MSAVMPWSLRLEQRARLLYQQIGTLQRLVLDSGGDETTLTAACSPYYRLLDELYQKDFPIARAVDTSDLLLHLDGEGLMTERPRLSLVTTIMGDVRKQVGGMIKTLVSNWHEGLDVPREIELGLSTFAPGSLFLGFTLPEPAPNQTAAADDPFFAAAREALALFGAVTSQLNEAEPFARICQQLPDPKLRDAALSAISHLAPTGRRGVTSVDIGGRAMQAGAWRRLTPETRLQVRHWLEQPVLSRETVEVRGRVRALDLDLRRLDLRRIEEGRLPDLRCIYPASFDPQAKNWLDQILVLRGYVELYQNQPRLLQITEVREEHEPGRGRS